MALRSNQLWVAPPGRAFVLPSTTTAVAQQSVTFKQEAVDGCKQRANSAGDFGPVGILDSARQLNVCPHRTFNLLRPWANLHLDLLTFTATAEPKVSVQLLQQPLATRVSHRVQSFCPQQSESVSSAQTLGAEISPRSRLVDKHAVNNPSAHISTFFYIVCLVST